MGTFLYKTKIIPKEEINSFIQDNPSIEDFFNNSTNNLGYITCDYFDLHILKSNGDDDFIKGIFEIFSTYNHMTLSDLKYFYSIFKYSKNLEYKNKLIAKLLFNNKIDLEEKIYKSNVFKFFSLESKTDKWLDKLLSFFEHNYYQKGNNLMVNRDQFLNYLKTDKLVSLISDFYIREDIPSSNFPKLSNEYNIYCDCLQEKKIDKTKFLKEKYSVHFSQLYKKFEEYEKIKGKYPFENLEILFSEVEIEHSFIELYIKYLKKKIGKKFLDFENFKNIFLKVIELRTEKERAEYAFEILAYPDKNEIKIKNLKEIFNKEEKIKSISKSTFIELYEESTNERNTFFDLLKSFSNFFDRINLIPYIIFELKPFEPRILRNLFKFLLYDNDDFKSYAENKILDEDVYFAISYEFNEQLFIYFHKNDPNEPFPILNLLDISEGDGLLKPNLVYEKDFLLIPKSLYIYIVNWFKIEGNHISCERINYNVNAEYYKNFNLYHPEKKALIVEKKKIIYEIEFYPIHTKIYTFEEIVQFLERQNKKVNIEESLNSLILLFKNNTFDTNRSLIYSRKEIVSESLKDIILKNENTKKCIEPKIYIFNNKNELFPIENNSFEDEKITYFTLLVIDSKITNDKNSITYLQKIQGIKENKNDNNNSFRDEQIKEVDKSQSIIYDDKKTETTNDMTEKDKDEDKKEIEEKEDEKKEETKEEEKEDEKKEEEEKEIEKETNEEKKEIKKDKLKNKKEEKKKKIKEKNNNKEKIEKSKKTQKQKLEKEIPEIYNIGLVNVGNTCYLNSTLQLLINLPILRDLFLDKRIEFFINRKGKLSHNGKLFDIFQSILDYRWTKTKNKQKDIIINPEPLKKISGNIREDFSTNEQQDANEFLNFILDELNEELNIKINGKYYPNLDDVMAIKNNKDELSNIYWANSIRRSASFINALFNFQLESILTCEKCKGQKRTFETYNNLYLPIPLNQYLDLEIVLFKIPFVYKIYYDKINEEFNLFNKENDKNSIMKNLKLFYDMKMNNTNEDKNKKEENEYNKKEFQYNSPTIRIKFNFEKNKTINDLLNEIRSIKRLELEPINEELISKEEEKNIEIEKRKILNLTSFIVCTYGVQGNYYGLNPISKVLKLDECIQNNSRLFIYETLNSNGINKLKKENKNKILVNYDIKTDKKNLTNPISQKKFSNEEILTIDNRILFYPKTIYKNLRLKEKLLFEYPIEINHYYSIPNSYYLFEKYTLHSINFLPDILIVNNTKDNYTARELYEYIWNRYKKYFNLKKEEENEVWWKKKIKPCYPFVIRICFQLNKSAYTKCAKCPWYKFCQGCIIDPSNENSLLFDFNNIIQVEWCGKIIKNKLINNKLTQATDVKIEKDNENDDNKKKSKYESTLNDCFKLFLDEEKLESQLKCSNCNSLQKFSKHYKFDKLPPILIISFQRFKYATMYNKKISTFIKYPLENLEINGEKFDLNGVINHYGSLNSGHYTSICKINNKWFSFNDSHINECSKQNAISENAYILLYVNKCKFEDKMYFNILKSLFEQINFEEDEKILNGKIKNYKEYFPIIIEGEPVNTPYGLGYIVKHNENFCEIKFNFGKGVINNSSIIMETSLKIGNKK